MARTLSEDLCGRVIAVVEAGATRRAAAERFGIDVASAIRWVRVFRTTGKSSAQAKGGNLHSHRIEAFRDVVLHTIEAQEDITLAEPAAFLAHVEQVLAPALWRGGTVIMDDLPPFGAFPAALPLEP